MNRSDPSAPVEWLFVRAGYPLVMSAAFALYLYLSARHVAPAVAAYAAISLTLPIIVVHEYWFPHDDAWGPEAGAFALDASYLVLVQIGVGSVLTLAGVWLLSTLFGTAQGRVIDVWPREWPVAGQFLLLTFASEFVGYWLHRAAHASRILWRIHAIHHSSRTLYWLAVCRSHPLEVLLQVCLVALPFRMLGAGTDVVFLYLVFVCVNGFYQHSNSEVQLGPLNYLVSGPEIHRWHHSRVRRESNANFGTNLIVWDALFGTRLLPGDRHVSAVGLADSDHPMTLWGQFTRPFAQQK